MNKIVRPPRVLADQFNLYDLTDFGLIPLHRADATRTKNDKTYSIGKSPIDNGWTKKQYDSAKVMARCIAENRNLGVRLAPDDLILDVDARHGGNASLEKFVKDMKIDLAQWPQVDTGSDGTHIYGKKPPGLKINKKLTDYPGLEFLSAGSQVVAAGSIHPTTLRPYRVNEFTPSLANAKTWPGNVLQAVKRMPRERSGEDAGEISPAQLATMLNRLDPLDYKNEQAWRNLMMASHHATDGDGVEEFITWSTSDPDYSDDEDLIPDSLELIGQRPRRRDHG